MTEKVGEDGVKLLELLHRKFTREDRKQSLADLEAAPGDPDNQADLRKKLKHALSEDLEFGRELQALLEGE